MEELYLILGKERIAHTSEQHESHQQWDKEVDCSHDDGSCVPIAGFVGTKGMSGGRAVAVRAAFQDKLICIGDQIEQIYNH